ncbi:hypothetical protein [Streptomyces sp. NPDC005533]|uniref:hypothetical protein n=1 Tax=Streptomyces sp. NPDC005533 TaxID=3364723 RepID=UPI00369C62DF
MLVRDEITSGRDPVTRAAVLDLLVGLREHQDLALVFLTYDLAAAAAPADRAAGLEAGRLARTGAPAGAAGPGRGG